MLKNHKIDRCFHIYIDGCWDIDV